MRPVKDALEVKHSQVAGAASTGTERDVSRYLYKTVQVSALGTSVIDIEGTIDGAWVKLFTGAAAGFHAVPESLQKMRVVTTTYNNNDAPLVTVAGFDSRTDGG
jgi:hypothetical protein